MSIPFDLGPLVLTLLVGWMVLSVGAALLFWAAVYIGSERQKAKQPAREPLPRAQSAPLAVSEPTDGGLVRAPVAINRL